MQSIVKIQTQLANFAGGGQVLVSNILSEVKADIIKTVGGRLSSEFESLLSLFISNTESIECNFSSLRQRIIDLEYNVLKGMSKDKDLELIEH